MSAQQKCKRYEIKECNKIKSKIIKDIIIKGCAALALLQISDKRINKSFPKGYKRNDKINHKVLYATMLNQINICNHYVY